MSMRNFRRLIRRDAPPSADEGLAALMVALINLYRIDLAHLQLLGDDLMRTSRRLSEFDFTETARAKAHDTTTAVLMADVKEREADLDVVEKWLQLLAEPDEASRLAQLATFSPELLERFKRRPRS